VTHHDVAPPSTRGSGGFRARSHREPAGGRVPREHYRGHTPRMSRLMAFIEQPEVIDLPVPGTCLRLPVAFATQTGAETHRQTPDREDPHPPPCLCRRQTGGCGPPKPTARRGGTRCRPLGTGSSPPHRGRPHPFSCGMLSPELGKSHCTKAPTRPLRCQIHQVDAGTMDPREAAESTCHTWQRILSPSPR